MSARFPDLLTFIEDVPKAVGGHGEPITEPQEVTQAYCKISAGVGREVTVADQTQAIATHTIETPMMQALRKVNPRMRVEDSSGRVFNLLTSALSETPHKIARFVAQQRT